MNSQRASKVQKSMVKRSLPTVIIILCCALLSACSKAPDISESISQLTFSTLSGDKIPLNAIEGPLLVNFWATDCGICLKEMPDLAELYQRYEPKGFELIAVAMPHDAPNLVVEMSEREQWPFPIALDIKGEAVQAFASVIGTPISYLLDKNGRLVKRYVGAIPMLELERQLDKLLELS